MTIVKDIYVPSHSFSDVIEMHTYLADPLKTDGGKYVRGLGFITDNYLVVYLHKDTKNPHLHFGANAVNFRTGNIFRQTKKELNRLKVHCNHILNDHCLDQIQMSPEDMLDTAPHDLSDGFEAFEIFDEIMMDKAVFFEDLYDEALFTQPDSAPSSDYNNNISFSLLNISGNDSNNTFKYPTMQELKTSHQEVNTMENNEDNKTLSTLSTSQLPKQILNKNCLIMDFSKNVNFRVPSSCNKSQLADLINNVTPVSEQERVHNAKIGIGALAELKNRGYDMPVYVDNSTNINITFDDLLSSDIDIIDARFTEE